MILVIDNYDSFTYNLVQYIGTINPNVKVIRNDQFDMDDIGQWNPTHIVVSPGPGRPENAGNSVEVIQKYGQSNPILGVCLGHQLLAYAYGAKVGPGDKSEVGVMPVRKTIDGKQSAVWLEALNRIHVQKSIIEWCLK